MKTFALLVAVAVCGVASQAEAGHGYRLGMTSIGFPMASYSCDRGYDSSCGCEAPACDTGCDSCCDAWAGFCGRRRCSLKGMFNCCKPACCEPVECCEPVDCCDPCAKRCSLKGLFRHCKPACCEPVCCEPAPCCDPCAKRCSLKGLFNHCKAACCEPVCCEPAPCCDPCAKRCSLKGLFNRCKSSCGCDTGCGCGSADSYEVIGEGESVPAAPEAPQPMAFRGKLQMLPVGFGL